MKAASCWIRGGYALLAASVVITVLANFVIRLDDWAAPTALTLMGFVVCLPLALLCFLVGIVMGLITWTEPQPVEDREDLENPSRYRWRTPDE